MSKIKFKTKYLVLFVGMLVFGIASHCGDTTDSQIKGKKYKSEGWVDDNTFRVTALGAPNQDAKGMVKRKTQAKEAAVIMAQKRIIEKMIGAQLKGASAAKDGESAGIVVTKEFQGMVKGGSIIEETYDEDDNCQIVYEIQARGLKKKAQLEIDKLNENQ